jgi:hypothetical protein
VPVEQAQPSVPDHADRKADSGVATGDRGTPVSGYSVTAYSGGALIGRPRPR